MNMIGRSTVLRIGCFTVPESNFRRTESISAGLEGCFSRTESISAVLEGCFRLMMILSQTVRLPLKLFLLF